MKSYRLTKIPPHVLPGNSNGKQYVIAMCDISTSNKSVAKFSTLEIFIIYILIIIFRSNFSRMTSVACHFAVWHEKAMMI